jgi:hypothetical protein
MEMAGRLSIDSAPMPRRIVRIDGRSKPAKRAKELAASFVAQLGDAALDAATSAAVQKAAELVVVAEEIRAKALRGEAVDFTALIKIENAARRAVADLGLDRKRPSAPAMTLADYLDANHQADADQAEETAVESPAATPAGEIPAATETRIHQSLVAVEGSSAGETGEAIE